MRLHTIVILSAIMLFGGFHLAAQSHSDTPSAQEKKGGSVSKPMEVAEQFLSKMEKQLLKADYSIELLSGTERQPVGNGNLQMLGNCFRLTIASSEAAFDGKTLYMYQESTNELTLSIPTEEELLDINPLIFARALLRASTVRFAANAKVATAANAKTAKTATNATAKSNPTTAAMSSDVLTLDVLPANKSAGIQRIVIKLRKADLAPLEIQIREQQEQTIIRFSHPSFASPTPSTSSLFQLAYPSAWLNDLR